MSALKQRLPSWRLPAWIAPAQRNLTLYWQRLAPRERRLLTLAAVVAGAALIWLVLLEPALNTTARLRASLPNLRAQAAQVDVIIAEARELGQQAGIGATGTASTAGLTDSLRRAGLDDTASLTALDSRHWEVSFTQAPMESILLWLRDVPFELRLRATRAELSRSATEPARPGLVSGSVTLSAEEMPR